MVINFYFFIKYFIESDEPLQLCLSSLNYICYSNCCIALDKFLIQVYNDYAYFIKRNNFDTR